MDIFESVLFVPTDVKWCIWMYAKQVGLYDLWLCFLDVEPETIFIHIVFYCQKVTQNV